MIPLPPPRPGRATAAAAAIPLTVLLATLMATLAGCGAPTRHPAIGLGVGPLPIESLEGPDRPAPRLTDGVTLLNFWGTWCPPCRRELPGLGRLAARLAHDPRFRLIAVSCGPGGPDDRDEIAADTRRFLEKAGLAIDAWCDPSGLTRSLFASAYGFEAFPTTYLIGPDGTIRRVWSGYAGRDEAEMAAAVLEALKACPPPREPAEPSAPVAR